MTMWNKVRSETRPAVAAQYVSRCPACGHDAVDAVNSDFGDYEGSRVFRCRSCTSLWEIEYTMAPSGMQLVDDNT